MSTTPYFRNLSRSQYEAFVRLLDGHPVRQMPTRLALYRAGAMVAGAGGHGNIVPPAIKAEHAAWRARHFDAEGKRIMRQNLSPRVAR